MSLCAIIPAAQMSAANAALQAAGYGPSNFSVQCFANAAPEFAALHTWGPPDFIAAVKTQPGVIVDDGTGDPVARLTAMASGKGAQWQPQPMPTKTVTAGGLYTDTDGSVWQCIQSFDRSIYSSALSTYPALIRATRSPSVVTEWVQPIDQFSAYSTRNGWTGQPDRVTHNGQWWVCTTDANVWEPGVSGWTQTQADGSPMPVDAWPTWVQPKGAQDAYAKDAKVTYNGSHYVSTINANVWSPDAYPAGWSKQ